MSKYKYMLEVDGQHVNDYRSMEAVALTVARRIRQALQRDVKVSFIVYRVAEGDPRP